MSAQPIEDRALGALPIAMAAGLLFVVSDTAVPSAVASLSLAVAIVLGARWTLTTATQWTLTALVGASGGVLMAALAPTGDSPGRVDRVWSVTAAVCVFAAVSRAFFVRPPGGARMTFSLSFFAVAVCAVTRVQIPYGLFVAVWLVAALAALRADDPARPRWKHPDFRLTMVTLGLLAASGLLGYAVSRALVPLHARVSAYILGRVSQSETVTGFTTSLDLSGLDGMLQSDTVVLRAYGPVDDYLRGAVYDRYDRVGWIGMAASNVLPVETLTGPLHGRSVVEVRRVSGPAGRYFLPLDARDLATTRGIAGVDPWGIVHVGAGDLGDVVWYRPGVRTALRPVEPTDNDVRVPPDVRAALAPLVASWTAGATGPGHMVEDLTKHLRTDFRYALHAPPPRRHADPVLDFVFRHRRGHCEYFASALALMCRTAGVPARVVGGYRVSERNAFGGYMVVRERNAHTWVEAWLPGHGWQTLDATPGGGESRVQNTSVFRALTDFAAAVLDASLAWVSRRRPIDLLAAAALAAGVLGAVRWLRARRNVVASSLVDGERPSPTYTVLTAALAHAGVHRAHGEALEHFADRIASVIPGQVGAAVATAVRDYAALRYGGEGDPVAVAEALARCATDVRHSVKNLASRATPTDRPEGW